jgi:hypothetical protein
MVFMMTVTLTAMVIELRNYWSGGRWLLGVVAACIFLLSLWLIVEAYLRIRRDTLARAAVAEGAEGD